MINHRSLRPIHEVHRANRIRRWLRNGGHGEKVWVEVLVECGAISEDLTEGGNRSPRGLNDGTNQFIVRYRKSPSLIGRKCAVHILDNLVSVQAATAGLQREPK